MQSFILDRHTDPSNPVMKVTQDDKIPIYDSQQDAEADLANLEENQIVGTKDNGNNNRYILQSEYKADNTYSTSEVNTGKTWIDGKPIYRKCAYSATNWTTGTTIMTLDNYDNIISISGTVKNNSAQIVPLFYSAPNFGYAYVESSGNVKVEMSGSFANSYPALVIIEYTKTTD